VDLQPTGQRAVVTGGGSGSGKATAALPAGKPELAPDVLARADVVLSLPR
jgi:NAD(P)-dependent dehydrogenase (short-subunit alcohol dehydrogenase family)